MARDVCENKSVRERSYMQAASTRVVTLEMCGNDGLQARSSFKSQTGTCNYAVLDVAINSCRTYVAAGMDYINVNAHPNTRLKVISNLHYAGYNADNVQSSCRDAGTGQTVSLRECFLPATARMNCGMRDSARQKGFQCADSFAQYMDADYDSNGAASVHDSQTFEAVLRSARWAAKNLG